MSTSNANPEPKLSELERRLVEVLSANAHVRWACLFGSAVRGGEYRDLDVGVVLDAESRGAVAFGSIASALEAAIPESKIDLVDLGSLAPAVTGPITRERRMLVDRNPMERAEWEIEQNRRALDIEPWLREFERLRLAALKEKQNADGGFR